MTSDLDGARRIGQRATNPRRPDRVQFASEDLGGFVESSNRPRSIGPSPKGSTFGRSSTTTPTK